MEPAFVGRQARINRIELILADKNIGLLTLNNALPEPVVISFIYDDLHILRLKNL